MKSTKTRRARCSISRAAHALRALPVLALWLSLALRPAFAATFNWAGNNSGNWNLTTATGWNTGGGVNYPKTTDDVANFVLNISADRTITINVADATIGSLTFNDNGGGINDFIVATSNAVTNKLNFNVTAGSATISSVTGANIISAPVVLNDPLSVSVTGTSLTVSGAISSVGSNGVTLTAGSLILSGANTYTGATSVNAGTLNIQNAAALGTTADGTTVASGAALEMQNGIAVGAEAISLAGTGISGNGALRNISGANSLAGTLTLTGATEIQADAGTLTLSAANSVTATNQNLTLDGAGDGAISGTITTGSGTLTKNGTGDWTLSGNNTYTGATSVNAGTLNIQHASALGDIASGTTVASGGALELQGGISVGAEALSIANTGVSSNGALRNISGANAYGGTLTLTGATEIQSDAGTLTLNAANSVTATNQNLTLDGPGNGAIEGTITTGSGTLTKNGAGTWTLGGNNTYTGLTTVSAGMLSIKHSSALGGVAGSTSVSNNAALELQGNITVGAEALSITGTGISSAGALRNLSGANTYGGTVTLGGATEFQSDAGTLTLSAANSVTGTNRNLTLDGSGNGAIEGTITTGNGTLNKNGSGTWTISGNNTFTGATNVNAGVLNIRHANATGTTAGGVSVDGGAVLELQGTIAVGAETLSLEGTGNSSNGALRNISGTNTWAGAVTLTAPTEIQSDAGLVTFSAATSFTGAHNLTLDGSGNGAITGVINTGAGAVTKTGSGTWTLAGASTYNGATTVNAGTLQISTANDRLPTDTNLVIDSLNSATFDMNGRNQTVAQLSNGANGGGKVVNNAAATTSTLTVTGTSMFSGSIEDGGAGRVTALAKSTGGVLTLNSANSYTGSTTISAGTINVQNAAALGSTAGGTTVSSGAVLELQGGVAVGAEPLSLAGTGIGSNGALRNVSGANSYGGTVTLTGAAEIHSTAGSLTLNAANSVTATNQNLTLDGAGSGEIGGTITTGSGTLTKTGAGTWTLSGNNTYTGATSVSDGLLVIQHGNALGGTSGGTTVANGATLAIQGGIAVGNEPLSITGTGDGAGGALRNVSGANSYGGTVNLTNDARIQSDAGSLTLTAANSITSAHLDVTLAGASHGTASGAIALESGGLIKTGAGTWTLHGANSYTGVTTIDDGVLEVAIMANGGSNSGVGASTTVASRILLEDATLRYIGTGHSSNRLFTQNGIANVIDASGTGPLNLTSTGALGVSNGTHTLTLTGSNTGANTIANEITEFNAGSKETKVIKTGAGTWVLTGANSYTGLTDVQAGIFRYGASNVINNGPVQVSGGTLDIGANSDTTGVVTLINGAIDGTTGTLTGNSYDVRNGSISAKLGGNNPLTKSTAGTVTMSGANTYTGNTTVSSGKLVLAATGSYANTAISVAGSAILAPQPGSGANSAGLTGAGSGGATLNLQAAAALDMTDNAIGVFNLNQQTSFGGTALTIGAAAGTPPTLTFDIGNAATGTDRINVSKAASVLASGGKIAISPVTGATSITSGNYILMTATSGLGVSGLTLSTPTITLSGKTYSLSLAASTSTTEILGVNVAAPGTAYWSGAVNGNWNTLNAGDVTNWRTDAVSNIDTQQLPDATTDIFFVTTTPVAANLATTLGQDFSIKSLTFTSAATSSASIGGGNTLTVGTGGVTVQSGSAAHTIASNVALSSSHTWSNSSSNLLGVSGNVTNGANSLSVTGSGNTTIAGVLGNGSGGLVKNGAGMLTLSGSNTYTGGTTVNAGQLILSNISGSAVGSGSVLVNSGAMIGGNGNADALVTLASGGIVSPGNSPGTLSFDDHLWNGGGKYLWEINNATGSVGNDPGWDLIDVQNSLTVSATTSDKFIILITSIGGDVANFINTGTTSWQIVSVPTTTGFDPAAFTLSLLADGLVPGSTGFTNNLNGGSFVIRLNQGLEPAGIYLDFVGPAPPQTGPIAIPEPSTLVMGLGGLAMAAVVRRRRRRVG